MKAIFAWAGLAYAIVLISSSLSAQVPNPPSAFEPTEEDLRAAKTPSPRLADGKPDFSGIWFGGGSTSNIADALPKGVKLPLLPASEKLLRERRSQDDPEANCLPAGIPRMAPYPWTFATAPGRLYMLFEGNIHSFRQIYMDGRSHPKDLNPTWYGHSIGRWEGDTLVVDTVGFNDKFWFDFTGTPHTEQLHTTERYTRPNFGTLVNEVTIDDPGAFSMPFTVKFTARLLTHGDIMEYICQENEKDVNHINSPAIVPAR